MMWRHKPDLLLFRSIARTGDLLSKHAPGILQLKYKHQAYRECLNFGSNFMSKSIRSVTFDFNIRDVIAHQE